MLKFFTILIVFIVSLSTSLENVQESSFSPASWVGFPFLSGNSESLKKPKLTLKTQYTTSSACLNDCANLIPNVKCREVWKQSVALSGCSLLRARETCDSVCRDISKCPRHKVQLKTCNGTEVSFVKKCAKKSDCMRFCVVKALNACIVEKNVIDLHIKECEEVSKDEPVSFCVFQCSEKVPAVGCASSCSKLDKKVPKHCRGAFLKRNEDSKCSLSRFTSECSATCNVSPFPCFSKCRTHFCKCRRFTSCKKVCPKSISECQEMCAWEKQEECYIQRMPPQYLAMCQRYVHHYRLKKCVAICAEKKKYSEMQMKKLQQDVESHGVLKNLPW